MFGRTRREHPVDFGVVARRLRRTQPVQLTRRRQGDVRL